ncbi:BrnT family toxin [Neisseria animalis]|uniref:BrnT family toxin n=1 Tax=Neisseria animalis TaxID=492 RepID=A0A5P3MVJ5_NEIAN|nr:BrnT family toxin [Neisseria animalis]QEY25085.1 BrnT family toxin [Neisseria animalis]ROW31864.1 BrnT family toxin [Neisseria animalis]VEE07723.1 Protein of uncharacterised function (DUF497) [Neisseria animalis]
MRIEFDPVKSKHNEEERGLPFSAAEDFEWSGAKILPDIRHDYPEPRYAAYGMIRGRLHFLCFTPLADGIRIISFRKANKREVKRYEQQTAD